MEQKKIAKLQNPTSCVMSIQYFTAQNKANGILILIYNITVNT